MLEHSNTLEWSRYSESTVGHSDYNEEHRLAGKRAVYGPGYQSEHGVV